MFKKQTPTDKMINMLIKKSLWLLRIHKDYDDSVGSMFVVTVSHMLMGIAALFDNDTPQSYRDWLVDILVENETKVSEILEAAKNAGPK